MKQKLNKTITILGLTITAICLLAYTGCATAPTKLEQGLFNVQTNYVPKLVIQTNLVTLTNLVTVLQTNVVEQPGGATITNVVQVTVPKVVIETNAVTVTNYLPVYVLTPGEGAQAVREAGTAIGNLGGVGGLVGTGIGALFSLWAWLRSTKKNATAVNLAQTVETIREFIKTLPNGSQYDSVLTTWMQQHQAEAGVLGQVITLLNNQVSNPDAKVAAQQVQALLDGLMNKKV